jgi:hypothetical protein
MHGTPRILAFVGVSFLLASAACGDAPFHILRVTPTRAGGTKDRWVQLSGSSNTSLEKFQQTAAQYPDQENAQDFVVVWRYAGQQRVDHVDVVFAFRQTGVDEERSMKLPYSAVGPGSAESVFRVAGEALSKGGSVEAWKVSLMVDGRVADTRSSWSWKR